MTVQKNLPKIPSKASNPNVTSPNQLTSHYFSLLIDLDNSPSSLLASLKSQCPFLSYFFPESKQDRKKITHIKPYKRIPKHHLKNTLEKKKIKQEKQMKNKWP